MKVIDIMNNKKNYTIYDIAKLSGFSPKTVSRVINNESSVRKETRQKIESIITEVAYSPNLYAKNLSKKESVNILVSVKKLNFFPLSWFQTLLDQILVYSKKIGVNIIVEYFGENDDITESIISSSGSFIDGVILFYLTPNDRRLNYLIKNNFPFIVFGKPPHMDLPYVNNNDFNSLRKLMEYFHNQDRKNVWLLMGQKNPVNMERELGAKSFNEDATKIFDITCFYGLDTLESVYEFITTKEINQLPEAIFISGDEKALSLIKALTEKKINIPSEIAVAGFDNIPGSFFYTPALTTISPNYEQIASHLLEGLIQIIKGDNFKSLVIDTEFVERESTRIN